MSLTTVSDLSTSLVTEFGGWTTNTTYVSKVQAFINDAFKDVVRAAQWIWLFQIDPTVTATVANQANYSLDSSAAEVRAVRLAGQYDQKLIFTPPEQMMTLDLELVGRPLRYWQSGFDPFTGENTLTIWPVPDIAYDLEVHELLRPTNLLSSDNIPVPDEILGILKDKVRHAMAMDDRDFQAADRYLAMYESKLKQAKGRYAHDSADERMNPYNDLPQRRPIPLVRLPYEYGGF